MTLFDGISNMPNGHTSTYGQNSPIDKQLGAHYKAISNQKTMRWQIPIYFLSNNLQKWQGGS